MFIETELNDMIYASESINIYNQGEVTIYGQDEPQFNEIMQGWKDMTESVHEMPAFGVSINRETTSGMQSGLWVEFVFENRNFYNGMPFEKLLVNVEKGFSGFNIIRFNEGDGYSGRCFYYDLVNRDMSKFYNILLNL